MIKYDNILKDKANLIYIISIMIDVYKIYKHHTQVLECEQWLTMLNRNPIKTEYTSDTLIVLKNIMNDGANYLLAVEAQFDDGKIAMDLMDNIIKLFKKD